ncbi:MAG: hypothetical protein M1821_009207 [Bathelium mastoideum]|nr:MAG: hypothetical protein M1821_009207 [Bathelium mastoideum]
MDFGNSQPPDLASVLAVLREYAPGQQYNSQNQAQHAQQHPQPSNATQYDDQYDPSQPTVPSISAENKEPTQPRDSPHPPAIDATTIVSWSAGLRCVSKAAAQNSWFGESIQKLIRDQRRHEQQWYMQRQDLKQQLASRGKGAKQAQDVLKSLGSATKIDTPVVTPEELEAELKTFDAKIYKAQCDMANVMSAELKALGVPFFKTKVSLVVKSSREVSDGANFHGSKITPMSSELHLEPGQIEEAELIKLQQRMLEYLEDMYKE